MTNLEKIMKCERLDEIAKITEKATQEKINCILNALNPMDTGDLPFIIHALELVALSFRKTKSEAVAALDMIKMVGDSDTTIITVDLPVRGGETKIESI